MIGDIVFMSFFFVRFLALELLSISYFTVVNSDLRLKHSVAGKQRSVALRNKPLTLTCSDWGVNPKASQVWGWSPHQGLRVAKPRANLKKKILLSPAKKKIQN